MGSSPGVHSTPSVTGTRAPTTRCCGQPSPPSRPAAATSLAETPAQILLGLLEGLLDGADPDVKDIVFLRSALIRSIDFYTPLNLKSHIRDSDLDVSWGGA